MAKSIEEILGRSIGSTNELRKAIKDLQDQLVNASSDTQEWTDTAEKLSAAQMKLSEVMNAGKQSIDAAEDSIVGMERQYKELYNTYKLLSDEQRNSPFGTEMAEQLETLSVKLNETKKGVGNFKDNIGHYADDAVAAFGQMGVSIGGLAGPLNLANGGFKVLNATMMANPVFWLIAGIKVLISLFENVKDAIAGNEESQMRWNEAMAAFQPIMDAVANGFDKLGQVVVGVFETISKVYSKSRELWAGFTDFIGLSKGARKEVEQQNQLYADLAKRTNELTKAKREQTKLNASQQAEVKTLLDQAAGTADAAEKMKLLNQAKEIQQEITNRNIAIAQEEYDVLLEKSKLTANDAEMNDKLAEAEANVARARAEGAEKTKEMTSQILGLTNQTNNYLEVLKKEKEELNNILKTVEENSKTELQKLEEKYKKEKALLEKYGKDTVELTEQYENDRLKIKVAEQENYVKTIRDLILNNLEGLEPETSYFKMLYAEQDYERIETIIDDTQNKLSNLAATTKVSMKDTVDVWKKAGIEMGSEFNWVSSMSDAMEVFSMFKKQYENAQKAYNRMVETIIPLTQNESAFIEKQTKLWEAKNEILNNEELSEIEKVATIKQLEDELQQYKAEQLKLELDNLALTNEEKIAKWEEYYSIINQMAAEAAENEEKVKARQFESNVGLIDSSLLVADSLVAIGDAISQNIERTMEDEDQTKESVEKKKKVLKTLQDVQMAVGIAAIAADTAAGIMGIWRGYAMEKVANAETAAATGPAAAITLAALNAKSLASAIIQTTGMGIMAAAQMASLISGTISNKKAIEGGDSGSGGAAGTIAAPAMIETTPYSYTRQIQTAEEEDALNQPIWVSVTDIESGLNHVKVVSDESTW